MRVKKPKRLYADSNRNTVKDVEIAPVVADSKNETPTHTATGDPSECKDSETPQITDMENIPERTILTRRRKKEQTLGNKILKVVIPKLNFSRDLTNTKIYCSDIETNETITKDDEKKSKKRGRKPGKASQTKTTQNRKTKKEKSPRVRKAKQDNLQTKPRRSRKKKVVKENNNDLAVWNFEGKNDLNNTEGISILIMQNEINFRQVLNFSYYDLYCNPPPEINILEEGIINLTNSDIQTISDQNNKSPEKERLPDLPALLDHEIPPNVNNLNDNKIIQDEDTNDENLSSLSDYLIDSSFIDEMEKEYNLQGPNYDINGDISLQGIIELFIKNCQVKNITDASGLKKGLCKTWLLNNYVCTNKWCNYSHNALTAFTSKLKLHPSKFVLSLVVTMRTDILFVDLIMAAFSILCDRMVPEVWVTFLIFFVFYITEPSDKRFFKFWINAASFFCAINEDYSGVRGFTSLLSIFSHGNKEENWKIYEFIKLIKQPPIQIPVSFALLQPILKLDVPDNLLIEAVQYCVETQEHVLKVYSKIIPKISFMSSPIHIVELLLKFCKTLEEVGRKDYADNLRQQLRAKIETIRVKIIGEEYPLTAAFQEEIIHNLNKGVVISKNILEEWIPDLDVNDRGDYFQLHKDFYQRLLSALDLSHDSLHGLIKTSENAPVESKKQTKEDEISERQFKRLKQFFNNGQLHLVGIYLNELKPDTLPRAVEMTLRLLFNMKISLHQLVDLIKILLLSSKSKSSKMVIASTCITLIFNLVRINEWDKAYTLLLLCQEKQINLVEGKVHFTDDWKVTQCRVALLLIEICTYEKNYQMAVRLVKEHDFSAPINSIFHLTWMESDEIIRIRILEELLWQMIYNELTDFAQELFMLMWRSQKKLDGPIGLRRFANGILTLLLNKDTEEAMEFYNRIKTEIDIGGTNLRAILVTLVRQNSLIEARALMSSPNQIVYPLPGTNSSAVELLVSSLWLEEELFILFNVVFDLFTTRKFENFDVSLRVSNSDTLSTSSVRPLCLGFMNPSFKHACTRIHRVLKYQFNPPVKLNISQRKLKLEYRSLQLHLQKRICKTSQ